MFIVTCSPSSVDLSGVLLRICRRIKLPTENTEIVKAAAFNKNERRLLSMISEFILVAICSHSNYQILYFSTVLISLSMTCRTIFGSVFYSWNICKRCMCIAMTIQTGAHSKFRYLCCTIHLFYFTMTVRTVDSLIHVHAMVKICIIRDTVNTLPWKRNTFVIIFSEFNNFRFVLARNGMTIHACRQCWNRRMRRSRNTGVAILTIDLHSAGVNFMGERNRLNGRISHAITFSAGKKECPNKHHDNNEENNGQTNSKSII